MLKNIIRFSLNNRLFVLVGAVLLVIGGMYCTLNTQVDVFPDLNAPPVVVMTEAGGMATEDSRQWQYRGAQGALSVDQWFFSSVG